MKGAGMFDSILQEATDTLLTQQAQIKRLHSIISWCKTRLPSPRAMELESLLREIASEPPPPPTIRVPTIAKQDFERAPRRPS